MRAKLGIWALVLALGLTLAGLVGVGAGTPAAAFAASRIAVRPATPDTGSASALGSSHGSSRALTWTGTTSVAEPDTVTPHVTPSPTPITTNEQNCVASDFGTGLNVDIWTGAVSNDAGTAQNWSAGVVPDGSTIACIEQGATRTPSFSGQTLGALWASANVQVSGALTITGTIGGGSSTTAVPSFVLAGTTLSVSNNQTITTEGALFINDGTIAFSGTSGAAFDDEAGFETGPSSQVTGAVPITVEGGALNNFSTTPVSFTVANPATDTINVTLSGALAAGQSLDMPAQDLGIGNGADTVTLTGSFANAGTITMDHSGNDGQSESNLVIPAGATLTNTGTISVSGSPSGSSFGETIQGALDNRGTLNVGISGNPAAYLTFPAGSTLDNDGGHVNVLAAAATSNNQSDTLSIAAATTGAGAQPAADFDNASGTLANAGSVAVSGIFTQGGGSVTGADSVQLSNGSAVDFTGSGPGAFQVADPNDGISVSLSGNLAQGQSLDMPAQDNGTGDRPVTVTATGSFTNAGTITMDHSGNDGNSESVLVIPSGSTLTNTGTISVSGSPNGANAGETIQGDLDNQGILNVGISGNPAAYLTFPAGSVLKNDGGTVNVLAASTTSNNQSDSLTLGPATTGTGAQPAASFNNASGTLADAGTVSVSGAFTQGAGTVTGADPVELRNGSSLSFTGSGAGAFQVADPNTDGINVTLSGNLAAGQSLDMPAQDISQGDLTTTVTATGSFTNAGTITIDHTGGSANSAAALVLPSGATLTNTGTINVSGDPSGSNAVNHNETISGTVINSGTLNVGIGTNPAAYLVFGTGSTLTNTGRINVAAGSTIQTGGSTVNGSGGSIVNLGTFAVTGSFSQGAGTVATGASDDPVQLRDGSSLDFTGTGAGAFQVANPVDAISVSLSGNIAAGQSLDMPAQDNGNGDSADTVTATGSFTNAGTITMDHTGGNANSTTNLVLPSGDTLTNASTGVISVSGSPSTGAAGHQETISGNVVNQGTLNVGIAGNPAAYLVLTQGDSLTNTGAINVGTNDTISTNGAVTNGAGGAIASLGTFAVNGSFDQDAGTIAGGASDNPVQLRNNSSLSFTGTGAGAFQVADPSTDAINVALSGNLAPGQSLDMPAQDIGQGNSPDTVTASGSFTNAGTITLDHTGGDNESEADLVLPSGDTLTNTGTISVAGSPGGPSFSEMINAALVNEGNFNVGIAGDAPANLTLPGAFTNVAGATVDVLANSTVAIGGAVDAAGGLITGAGNLDASGTFDEFATADNGNPIQLANGAALNLLGSGAASFETVQASATTLSGNIAPTQTVTINNINGVCGGTLMTDAQSLTNFGTLDFESNTCGDTGPGELNLAGTLSNAGTIIFDANSNGSGQVAGQLVNTANGTIIAQNGGDGIVSGPFTNNGTVQVTDGSFAPTGGFSNESATGTLTGGTFELAAASGNQATLRTPVPVTDLAATLDIGAGGSVAAANIATIERAGTLSLQSGFTGSVTATTLTNKGDLELAPGVAAAENTYSQTVSGQLGTTLAGPPSSAANYGALAVSGTAQIAGALAIHQAAGLTPNTGDAYVPLTAKTLTGSFGQVTGAGINATNAFAVSYSGTAVTLTDGPGPQLTTTAVSAPGTLTLGQNVTVGWTVTDTNAAASGNWTDAVYLSPTPSLTRSSVLIGNAAHTGGLGLNASYQGSLTAPVPGVLPGTWYVVVVTDAGDETGNLNTSGAVAAGSAESVTETQLQPGGTNTGTIPAGGDVYVAIQPGANQTLNLTATFGAADTASMYVAYGAQPSPGNTNLGFSTNQGTTATQTQTISPTQGGVYYIDLNNPTSGPVPYTLAAANPTSAISAVSPASFDFDVTETPYEQCGEKGDGTTYCNSGIAYLAAATQPDIVMTIHGTGFTPATTASLACSGLSQLTSNGSGTSIPNQTLTPVSLDYVDSTEVYANFGPVSSISGSCDLTTSTAGITATDRSAISFGDDAQIDAADATSPDVSIDAPSINRPNVDSFIQVNYSNPHAYPIPAPVIIVDAAGATLHYVGDPGGDSSSLPVLGVSPTGEPGTLAPGAKGTVSLAFDSTLGEHQDVQFGAETLQDAEGTIDFGGLVAEDLPAGTSQAVIDRVKQAVPQNLSGEGFTEEMDADADYLHSIGEPSGGFGDLIGLELARATNYGALLRDHSPSLGFGPGMPGLTDTASTDSFGNVTITTSTGGTVHFQNLASGGYAASGGSQATLVSDPNGGWLFTAPDGSTITFDKSGQETQSTDVNQNATAYSYDSSGEVTQIAAPHDTTTVTWSGGEVASTTDSGTGVTVNYGYDATGRLTSVNGGGTSVSFTWNESDNIALDGTLASVTSAAGGGTTSYTYNTNGQLISVTGPDGTVEDSYTYPSAGVVDVTDAMGNTTVENLDAGGNVVRTLLPDGTTQQVSLGAGGLPTMATLGGANDQLSYDSIGDLASVTDPGGNQTDYGWSAAGQLSSITEPNGDFYSVATNANGQETSVTDPSGTSESATYDKAGDLQTITDRDGRQFSFGRDGNDNVSSITGPAGMSDTYTYNSQGEVTSATDAAGDTTHASYDALGRLTGFTYPNGLGVSYTYDGAGRQASETISNGKSVTYAVQDNYGADGLLSSLTNAQGTPLESYTYNADRQPSLIKSGNGATQLLTYNSRGEVATITDADSAGNQTNRYVYTHNALGQTTAVTSNAGTATYAYDPAGELASATEPDGRKVTYTYDSAGNRISATDSGGSSNSYKLGADDEYTSDGQTGYTYDGNGSLTSSTTGGQTTTYTWTPGGQLASVTGPSGTVSYGYDALGDLISETDNGTTTEELTDPLSGARLGSFDSAGTPEDYYPSGADGVIGQISPGGQSYYYNYDATGNIVALTNSTGAAADTFSYLPFGGLDQHTGTVSTPFGFQGQDGITTDAMTGLTHNGLRWYSPTLGRFISQDGDLTAATNPYGYANNDPLDFTDATGRSPESTQSETPNTATETVTTTVTCTVQGAAGYGNLINNSNPSGYDVVNGFGGLGGQTVGLGSLAYANGSSESNALGGLGVGITVVTTGAALYQDGQAVINAQTDDDLTIARSNQVLDGTNGIVGLVASQFGPPGFWFNTLLQSAEGGVNCVSQQAFNWWFSDYYTTDPINHDWKPKGPTTPSQSTDSDDPNSITGPMGVGAKNYVPANAPLSYEVNFTNDATANLPANKVVVTEPLDQSLDLSTFSLGSFGFAHHTISPPPGLTSYTTTIPDANSGEDIKVTAKLNASIRTVVWTFQGLDPSTGEPPASAAAGWLEPDQNPPEGEGFVTYNVSPSANLATGTTIAANASIVFDGNAAINTPTVSNAIDASTPSGAVAALPATETGPFTVSWADAASDPAGVASYDVEVSDNGGAYEPLETATTDTSTTYTGQVGHTYSFIAWATDGVGNEQTQPASAQAYTLVVAPGSGTTTTQTTPTNPPATTTQSTPTNPPATTTATTPTPTPSTRTLSATDDNQTIREVVGEGSACLASTAKLSLVFSTAAIKGSKKTALTFKSAAVSIDRGVELTRKVKEKVKVKVKGKTVTKTKLVTQHYYGPNATITRASQTVNLSLKGLKSGTHTLKTVITYTEKVSVKKTVLVKHKKVVKKVTQTKTLTKTLTTTIKVC